MGVGEELRVRGLNGLAERRGREFLLHPLARRRCRCPSSQTVTPTQPARCSSATARPCDGACRMTVAARTARHRRVPRPSDRATAGAFGYWLEDPQLVVPQPFAVSTPHVVQPNQQTVVHDAELLEQRGISLQLLFKQPLLCRPQFYPTPSMKPIQIFQHRSRLGFVLWILSSNRRALEIKCFVYVTMGRKEVIHNDKVNLGTPRKLDAM